MLRGDAKVALNREYRALYDYERVLKQFWGSDAFPIAVQRELEIGLKYAHGRKIRVWGLRIGDAGEVAVEILIRVQERLPGSELAERAAIELADYFYRQRKMRLAHDAYDLYLENFPEGSNRMRAMQRLIQTDIARFKGPKYDSAGLIDAQIRIEDFLARFPTEADRSGINEALIVRIDESRGAQLLDTAKWYLKTGDWPSARLTLQRLVRDHPKTLAAHRANEILSKRGWSVAVNVPVEMKENHLLPDDVATDGQKNTQEAVEQNQ